MRGYRVVIVNGPAAGWGYVTSVPPDPVIAVAPMPRERADIHGNWMRVLVDADWPGARRYEREPTPDPAEVTADDDLICKYRVVE